MTTIHSQKQEKQTQNMENEVRQRKPIPFLEDWRRNDVEMKFEECLGQFQLRKKWGKTVNSHKKSREKLKKFKETVFETQNTPFSRLKQVAKTLNSQNCEKFSKCFSRLEGLSVRELRAEPRKSMYLSRLDLLLANKSPKSTRKLVAKACALDDLRLSRQNRATLFLKFFSFCKNRILFKNT